MSIASVEEQPLPTAEGARPLASARSAWRLGLRLGALALLAGAGGAVAVQPAAPALAELAAVATIGGGLAGGIAAHWAARR